jgi:hypothetical protein
MTERRVARLSGLVAAFALVAACGGNGGAEPEFSLTDQAQAETINVRAKDLPQGWASALAGNAPGDGGGEAVDRTFDECLARDGDVAPTADSSSQGFRLGELKLSSRVIFAPSEKAAGADLAALKTERASFCFKQAVETATRELEPVPTSVDQTTTTVFLTGVTVERLTISVPEGDDSVAMRATAVLRTINGAEMTVTSDRVAFVKGRAIVAVTFVSSPAPFPSDLEQTLLSTLASRA